MKKRYIPLIATGLFLFVVAGATVYYGNTLQLSDPVFLARPEGYVPEPIDTEGTDLPEIIVNESVDIPKPKASDKDLAEVREENKELIEDLAEVQSTEQIATIGLPNEVNLDIPFFAQAPDGDWSLPWKEACEEASLALAAAYLTDERLSKSEFKQQILDMTGIEENQFGTYIDTNMEQTAQLFEQYYGIGTTKIIDNPTIEQIQSELASGHPIIAPFAGKKLGNSYFTNGGPRYHVLVVRGYDEKYFYTNDVGTKRGENFPYDHDTFMYALHDLVPDGTGDIETGAKRILVLMP